MAGKDKIIHALKDKLKIDVGETTPDHKFTLLTTNCMGWCHKGPAMLIDDDVYTELTPKKAVEVIDNYLEE
jgi:NADH:ubiquinone oxidoreductase subunit E